MAKGKKSIKPDKDMKIAVIVAAVGAMVMGVFFFWAHKREEAPPQKIVHAALKPAAEEGVDRYLPNENVRGLEPAHPLVVHVTHPSVVPGSGGKIAFIIDDWGQSMGNCKYLKEIPDPMAVSILPGLRHTKDIAQCAELNNKLTMLHLPLEAQHNYDIYPPDYIIKTSMKPELVARIVQEDMDQLPLIEGVNNHMGSKATEDRALMSIILKKVQKKGLFFVDSMTAHNTVCEKVADELDMPFGKRDVFLDNVNTREAIVKQILVLAQKARHRGYAVAIGHDRHLTMQVLKEEIPWLKKQGFHIVSITELLKNR